MSDSKEHHSQLVWSLSKDHPRPAGIGLVSVNLSLNLSLSLNSSLDPSCHNALTVCGIHHV